MGLRTTCISEALSCKPGMLSLEFGQKKPKGEEDFLNNFKDVSGCVCSKHSQWCCPHNPWQELEILHCRGVTAVLEQGWVWIIVSPVGAEFVSPDGAFEGPSLGFGGCKEAEVLVGI